MSTLAISPAVSAFYEVSDVLGQPRRSITNRSHLAQVDTRAMGTPITNRNNLANELLLANTRPQAQPSRMVPPPGFMPLPNMELPDEQWEHRYLERSLSESQCGLEEPDSPGRERSQSVNSTRYKTELCRPYEESGYCKYGDKCQFAHGMNEQRTLSRHPKYKTDFCRTFHTIGFCPYGPRCHFIHNEDERQLGQMSVLKNPPPPTMGLSSQPTPIQRPKALNFLNMPPVYPRESLGSSGGSATDSPNSSVTGSPTMSPTFLGDDYCLGSSTGSSPGFTPLPASAPPCPTNNNNAFNFQHHQQQQQLNGVTAPLSVQTRDPLSTLAAGLQAAVIRDQQQRNMNNNFINNDALLSSFDSLCLNDVFLTAPPSPPDSLGSSGRSSGSEDSYNTCGSPLDVSRGLRLPIFNRFSTDE